MSIEEYTSALLPMINLCMIERERNPSSYVKTQLWHLYEQAFYGFIEFVDWDSHCRVSSKALAHYRHTYPDGHLKKRKWFEQKEFNLGGRHSAYLLEHVYTGEMFRNAIDSLGEHHRTVEHIVRLVQTEYCVAWILRQENGRLPRSRRGKTLQDALDVYRKVGIELL